MAESRGRAGRAQVVLGAGLVSVCVFVISYLAAWREFGGSPYVASYRIATLSRLLSVYDAIERHREETGSLPGSTSEVTLIEGGRVKRYEEGQTLDQWGSPIEYRRAGDGFVVCSYGRDRRPGGRGPDGDLCADGPNRAERSSWDECFPTLAQFAFELNTGGMLGACILSSLLAAGIYAFAPRRTSGEAEGPIAIVAGMIVTLIGTLIVAAVLVFLFAPKGH